jgi:beta-N-acetylhexosaminidase
MLRRRVLAGVAAVAVPASALVAFGTGSRGQASATHPGQPKAALSVATRPAERVAPHRSLEQSLSLEQLAGQRIVYAYSGLKPPASLLAAIRSGQAAGVIFYGPNISSLGQIRSVIAELQRANASSPVHAPLLMLADQEGGEVRRLPGAPQLSEKQIGESANAVALSRQAGAGAGGNLAGVGMNLNLAPVLDVFRQPGDFIDEFQRSYAADQQTVAALGAVFVSAQQATGVAATVKHFPGPGAATRQQNTDLGPVTLGLSLHQLRTVDEVPYRSAIATGVKLVMTSWAVYPALDSRLPAGLSATVINRELRGRLGFRGVTITDGIEAGALRQFGTLAQRGVLAAGAGADLVLCSAPNVYANTPAEGAAVRDGIASALADRRLARAAAEQAAARVIALRSAP